LQRQLKEAQAVIVEKDGAIVRLQSQTKQQAVRIVKLEKVEIGAATRTMAHWTRGNIEPYFRLFPVLAQLVGRVHKPKVARAMLYKFERLLLYNEKHPDVLTFFAENCLTLRETIIENWHSILTYYVNHHVSNVAHSHYEKASCMAGAVRRLRSDLGDHLLNRKPAVPERLGLLEQMQTKAFEETNERVAEFLFKPFREMLAQLDEAGKCSGDYADQLWPRCNHLKDGQEGLEKALLSTEDFHRQLLVPVVPTTLLSWLNHTKTTVRKVHEVEFARRGLPANIGSEKKGGKSQRIFDHVTANPGGFAHAQTGLHCDARPIGFDGDLPVVVVAAVTAAAAEEAANAMGD